MNESVESEAFVIPSKQRFTDRRLAVLVRNTAVLVLVAEAVDLFLEQEFGIADFLDLDPAKHLANDHLDVLIVDVHALQAIDFLDLVHEVVLQRLHSENTQNIVRVQRSVHERFARRGRGRLPAR